MIKNSTYFNEVIAKLKKVRTRKTLKQAYKSASVFLIAAVGLFLLFTVAEFLGHFSTSVRTILYFVFLSIAGLSFLYLIIKPLLGLLKPFKQDEYYAAAKKVGDYYPNIKDELINAIQLTDTENKGNYSNELIEAAFKKVYEKSAPLDFNETVSFCDIRKYARIGAGLLAVNLLLFEFIPQFALASNRLHNYDQRFVEPQKFQLEVKPGNAEIVQGEDFYLKISASGEAPKSVDLYIKSKEDAEFTKRNLQIDSTKTASFTKTAVRSNFKYYATASDVKTQEYNVNVINPPLISELEFTINPPSYSGLPERVQKDNGNISALKGSKVKVQLQSNKSLASGSLIFGKEKKRFNLNARNGETQFQIMNDGSYHIEITDTSGYKNRNPINYNVQALTDEVPSVEIVSPEKSAVLGEDDKLAINAAIMDDYGFSKLELNYRLSESEYRQTGGKYNTIKIPFDKTQLENDVYYVWDLAPLRLGADEVVSYYLEVFDNDFISGPKSAKTPLYTVRVPSLDELLSETDKKQKSAQEDLAKTLKEAEELKKEFEKISNDLKKDKKEITWEEKEKVEKAVEKFKQLQKKAEDVGKKMKDMQKQIQDQNLFSEETMKKYQELQKMFDEMNDEDLQKAFEDMNKILENMKRDNVQDSFEDMKANEEAFKKSIERTINLLKRIQIEQKVDELVKRSENIEKTTEEVKQKTENSDLQNPKEAEEIAKRQEEVSKKLDDMEQEMKNLEKMMEEFEDMPKEELQKMMEEFKKQQNQKLSKEAMEKMKEMQKMETLKKQQQLSQNMQSMKKQMQQMKQQMQRKNQVQVMREMMKAMNNLLQMSKEQEELKNNSKNLSQNSPKFKQQSREQSQLQRNMDKMMQQFSKLSQKTFAITPEMGKALGQARSEMSQSVSSLQKKNKSAAASHQTKAMGSLNEAASLMKGAMSQMMQGGQGGGMMSLMQQMKKLSQQQMQLNQMTKQMKGKMSARQRAQMQKLAKQQQMIQKSLEQLNKENREAGESKKLTEDLGKIAEEMREVVKNMQTESIDDDLIKQQENILSRMLDAQRSVNERDFEKRRISRAGEEFNRESPPELNLSSEEAKNLLKDELLKAVKEGYSKDYEALIRKYFKKLQSEKAVKEESE